MEMGKLTCPQLTLPNEIQMVSVLFFFLLSVLNEHSLVFYQPLAVFQSFETVDSGKFSTVFSLALWLRGPYSAIFIDFPFSVWLLKVMSCSTEFYFGSCFPSTLKICHELCSSFHCFHWEVSHQSYCLSFEVGVTFLYGPFKDLFFVCFWWLSPLVAIWGTWEHFRYHNDWGLYRHFVDKDQGL